MISKFELQAFRCFKEKQTLVFAIPNEGKIGSGITYLVGINNCGKTSFLEGLKLNATQSITSSVLRNSDIRSDDIYFAIYDEKNRVVQKLVPVRQGSARLKNVSSHTGEPPMAIFIPSRRQWSPVVNNDLGIDNFKNSYSMSNVSLRQRSDGYIDSQMADIFCSIESDEDSYRRFVSLMREVFPDFTSFTVEKEESAVIAYKMNDGARHRADFLGDGIISVMRIVAYLIINKNQLIVIDEPELSLHPSALRKLSYLLAKSAERQQILLATHSPYLIDWEYISNGAKLNHIVYSDGESAIYTLGEVSKYKGLITGANWQQPF